MNRTDRYTAPWVAITAVLLWGMHSAIAAPAGADYFPNVPLVNQDGETLHFYDDVIKGKVVAINFMFTSCGDICPLETAKLRDIQTMLGDHVGKNVFMYSITVDPDRDTPAVLKAYREKFKVGPGWQFLTGKIEDIDRIRKKLAMYNEDGDELSDHSINFVLGNEKTGQWLKRTPFDVPEAIVSVLLERLQTHSLMASNSRQSYTEVRALPSVGNGKNLFLSRCTTCHTMGQGDKLGPDLLGVVSRRDRQWLTRWLKEPEVMLKEKDPLAIALLDQYNNIPMPNLKLKSTDISDLIEYMQEEERRVNATPKSLLPQPYKLQSIIKNTAETTASSE